MKKLIVLALVSAPLFAFASEQNDLVARMPKMPPQAAGYQCLKNVDCMPIVSDEMVKYCQDTEAYAAWARLNCGFDPAFSF